MGRSKLTPEDVVVVAADEGVRLSVTTLATWRTRCPDRLPFRKIAGRVYYERSTVEEFLGIGAHSTDAKKAA